MGCGPTQPFGTWPSSGPELGTLGSSCHSHVIPWYFSRPRINRAQGLTAREGSRGDGRAPGCTEVSHNPDQPAHSHRTQRRLSLQLASGVTFHAGPVLTTEQRPTGYWPVHPNLPPPRPQPSRTPDNSISQMKSCFLRRCMSSIPEELRENTHTRPPESGAGYVSPPWPDPTTDVWAAKKHAGGQELSPPEKGTCPSLRSPRHPALNVQPPRAEPRTEARVADPWPDLPSQTATAPSWLPGCAISVTLKSGLNAYQGQVRPAAGR